MNIESQDIEELNATGNEKEEVTEQVQIAIAMPEIIRDLKSCQSKKIILIKDKELEEVLQPADDELEIRCN